MKTRDELIASLHSDVCPACGKRKYEGKSTCIRCWRKLDGATQKALYRRIGNGYEEAFADAMSELARIAGRD